MKFLTNNKTNWKYILIVFVLAVVVGGGTWYYSNLEASLPSENETTDSSTNLTSSWKTYRNDVYEVKYPPEYFANEFTNGKVIFSAEQLSREGDNRGPIQFFVLPMKIDDTFNLLTDLFKTGPFSKDAEIAGVHAQYISGVLKNHVLGWGGYQHTYILLDIDEETLQIDYNSEDRNTTEIFNMMLDTLKFLPQDDETTDWKAYQNEEYGFEIKYPSSLYIRIYSDKTGASFDDDLYRLNSTIPSMAHLRIESMDYLFGLSGKSLDSTVEDYLNIAFLKESTVSRKSVGIKENNYIKIDYYPFDDPELGIATSYYISLPDNDNVLMIHAANPEIDSSDWFQGMIKSLKINK